MPDEIDSYEHIRNYASLFSATLTDDFQSGIGTSSSGDENFAVLMGKPNVQRLLNVEGCESLAAVIGIEKGSLTISLLCAGSDNKILPAHIKGTLAGEEVWTFKIQVKDMPEFLPAPKP
jgi:hypothetical protein